MARNKHPEVTIGRILDVSTALFLEKGYEKTTIQDIINGLGDLSKGAIYHHFSSKDEIITAAINRINSDTNRIYDQIRASTDCTGLEKLKELFSASIGSSYQETVIKVAPNLLKNPKFLARQLESSIYEIAPLLIEPIIMEGVADGSIQTDYPAELAEVIIFLSNIWLNPLIFNCSSQQLLKKSMVFKQILLGLNLDIFDDGMIAKIARLHTAAQREEE